MKRLALAAAGAAVAGLAACSHTTVPTAPTAAPASHSAITSALSGNCSQRYHTWERGQGKGLLATFHAVGVASTAGNPQVLTAALKKAKPAVTRAARYPVPACADPRGYWSVLLMHLDAAAATKGPPSSVRAAVKDVPKIEQELTTELKATAR